jgi:hypothetical protein
MADFMRDGTIGVSATAAGRAGAIFIRTAASVPSDSRQQLPDNARLLRRGRVSLLINRAASVTPRSANIAQHYPLIDEHLSAPATFGAGN